MRMSKDRYAKICKYSTFLNKVKDTLSKYGYSYTSSFRRTCNDDFYSFSGLQFGEEKTGSVYIRGNIVTDYLSIEYDTMVYSFLPTGKHSFSFSTARYVIEDTDKFNFKILSKWAEAQFNILQLYKKCEKEKLVCKKLAKMKKDF